MHRPPAVSHSVRRSRWHRRLLLGIWLLALGPLFYAFISNPSPLPAAALAAIWLVCGWLAMRTWHASATGLLQWDGEHWHWIQEGEGQPCRVHMVWDFQQCVLVRLSIAEAPGLWLWLESGASVFQWDALRRALVSSSAGFTEPSPTSDLEGQR